jgi:acyl dehydratase
MRVDGAGIKGLRGGVRSPTPHTDEVTAAHPIFRGLAASGWHTAAITLRLMVDGDLKPAGGIIGMGFEEFSWPQPVRPGDELHITSEVLEVRPSKSRPEQGLLKLRTTTFNQKNEIVQMMLGTLLVRSNLGQGPGGG